MQEDPSEKTSFPFGNSFPNGYPWYRVELTDAGRAGLA
jgi:hypothetical protein